MGNSSHCTAEARITCSHEAKLVGLATLTPEPYKTLAGQPHCLAACRGRHVIWLSWRALTIGVHARLTRINNRVQYAPDHVQRKEALARQPSVCSQRHCPVQCQSCWRAAHVSNGRGSFWGNLPMRRGAVHGDGGSRGRARGGTGLSRPRRIYILMNICSRRRRRPAAAPAPRAIAASIQSKVSMTLDIDSSAE